MKALCVADLHLTDNTHDEYRHAFIGRELPRMLGDRKPDALFILGDLTEAKDRHSAVLVNKVVDHLAHLSAHCPVIILMGNHDYANEGEPFFAFTRELPNVHFINRPTEGGELPKSLRQKMSGCLFLPHSRDVARDWSMYGDGFDAYDFIFCHQTFQDADAGFGRKLDGTPTTWFDICQRTLIIAGDIHKPQSVGPVEYVGAPYTIDFGDDYKPRLLVIDGTKWRSVGLAAFPQKKLIHCPPGTDLEDARDILNANDLVRVRVDVDDMEGWREIVDIVHRQAQKLEVIIERVEPILLHKTKRHSVKPVSGDSKQSDAELVRQFADRNRLSDGVLDAGLDIVEGK